MQNDTAGVAPLQSTLEGFVHFVNERKDQPEAWCTLVFSWQEIRAATAIRRKALENQAAT